jgi:isoquinoline 1-oxidoreductase beta subunit
MKIPGVKKVLKTTAPVFAFEREGVAVLADSLWAALEGRKALKVEWDDLRIERLNTDQLYARMREDLEKTCFVSTIRRQCRWCF